MSAQVSTSKLVTDIAADARRAARQLVDVRPESIKRALRTMAALLGQYSDRLARANRRDLAAARSKGLSTALIDRLTISDRVVASMDRGLREIARIQSPIGVAYAARSRPNGLRIYKVRVPIGVIGIIYESRPNVTVDAAAICLKSQNAVILRGGSESFHSNLALARLFSKALRYAGLPPKAVQLVPTTDRRAVDVLLAQNDTVDLIIPRGGEGLIKTVVMKSRIPVIKHYKGVCHVFVSRYADMAKALAIAVNAKVQRPGVCNAMETLLLDNGLPSRQKKRLIDTLLENNVSLVGDSKTQGLNSRVGKATTADWQAEYLDLRLAVRCVNNVDRAIDHINTYGSRHTEAIISESEREIKRFLKCVDSSSLMVNASTRFSDGGEYGMGCEIGISTDKLHARGPMGVEDMTTYKWIVEGNGQIRT